MNWITIDKDNFKADFEQYTLRIEHLNVDYWFWGVYADKEIATSTTLELVCKTGEDARLVAEAVMKAHKLFFGLNK